MKNKYNLTVKETLELYKCSKDIVYFVENYCKLMDSKIVLCGYQKEILESFQNSSTVVDTKDIHDGMNTIISLYSIWMCIFNYYFSIYVLTTSENKQKIYNNILTIINSFDDFIKHAILNIQKYKTHVNVKSNTDYKIVFNNYSRIILSEDINHVFTPNVFVLDTNFISCNDVNICEDIENLLYVNDCRNSKNFIIGDKTNIFLKEKYTKIIL